MRDSWFVIICIKFVNSIIHESYTNYAYTREYGQIRRIRIVKGTHWQMANLYE